MLKDIYGYRIRGYYEYGLADATDESDLDIKLLSLKEKWNGLCPGFYDWFQNKRRLDFVDSVIQSAREGSDVKGLYFQNDVESREIKQGHQERVNNYCYRKSFPNSRASESRRNTSCFPWSKVCLTQQYKKFSVESSVWRSWSEERRMDHVKKIS